MGETLKRAAVRARVLVVDDEPTLRETVRYNLLQEGYAVALAADGPAALAAARAEPPDLVVLDVMLPGMDGLQVCRALRTDSTVPILLLSARGEEFDRVLGLELGADDYLTKPFAMRELLARVRAMLRRSQMAPTASRAFGGETTTSAPPSERPVVAGGLVVDGSRRQARMDGTVVPLKPKEFDLLHYLTRHPGVALSRDVLLREVWGYDYPITTRTVDVHVSWLRQKVEPDPDRPRRIETVRGFGYRFVPDAD